MLNYTWNCPVKILFGAGQLNNLAESIKGIGKTCFLVIGGGSVKHNGSLQKVTEQLKAANIEYILFEGIEPNPTSPTVERAKKELLAEKCDFVLSLGGGSVMDAGKLIAFAAKNKGNIWDYVRRDAKQKTSSEALPNVCVSTFSATGSETNKNAVLTNPDTGEKIALINEALLPRLAVVDPLLTTSLSPEATASGGIDIICHAMEKYWSQQSFNAPLQDRISESIMKTVVDWLPIAMQDGTNIEARTNLALASSYAMMGLTQGQEGSFPLHMIEHPLSGIYNITHGFGLASLLPELLLFNMEKDLRMVAKMARAVFGFYSRDDTKSAINGIDCLVKWLDRNQILFKLSELGVNEDHLERAAKFAVQLFPENTIPNIRPLTQDDVLTIYNESM
ncbi:MAG: iron-containing alcohol dehydrogenase [Fibrobacteria bacterium]|nr:iron-containing alcohol dehydrogenase [Fibrobacteria bacterium]